MKKYSRFKFFILFFAVNLFLGTNGIAKSSYASLSILSLAQLPPLSELEQAVLDRAGMDPKRIDSWEQRSRWASALPRLQVGWESKLLNQNTTIIQDNLSVTSSGITVGPESNRLDADVESNQNLEVRAVWAFDELLFNQDELAVSREARDLYFVRTKLIEELHQAYFDLKSLLLTSQENPEFTSDLLWQLKVERQIEKLNSLTGGLLERNISPAVTPISSLVKEKQKLEKEAP